MKNLLTYAKNSALALVVILLWVIFFDRFLSWFDMPDHPFINTTTIGSISKSTVLFSFIFAPLWEEAAFRWAPLTLARSFDDVLLRPVQWPIILISSILFGWMHGHTSIGIFMQGTIGLVFSVLMIKNNYTFWPNVIAHLSWNLFCEIFIP